MHVHSLIYIINHIDQPHSSLGLRGLYNLGRMKTDGTESLRASKLTFWMGVQADTAREIAAKMEPPAGIEPATC
jgi:hypothetical protein